jgi:hypothetical protein
MVDAWSGQKRRIAHRARRGLRFTQTVEADLTRGLCRLGEVSNRLVGGEGAADEALDELRIILKSGRSRGEGFTPPGTIVALDEGRRGAPQDERPARALAELEARAYT